jgi:methyl-accepting chemotaxis protein
MKMTLSRKMAFAFVMFGLVPLLSLALYSSFTAEDVKALRRSSLRRAAATASEQIDRILLKNGAANARPSVAWSDDINKDEVHRIFNEVATDFDYQSATFYLIAPPDAKSNRGVVVRRTSNSERTDLRIVPAYFLDMRSDGDNLLSGPIPLAEKGGHAATVKVTDRDAGVALLVGYASLTPSDDKGNHPVVLVSVPQADVYRMIDRMQMYMWIIFAVWTILILLAGFWAGRQFVTPIEHIMEITQSLQEGHLDQKTQVDRRDELGKLGEQVNSVITKLGDVVGQIRVATGSVSTASHELNASAQGLSQGATQQAGTLQEIATSLREVDDSVGRNAEQAKTTARTANQASSQAEKGGEAVHETVTAMRQIAQKITIVEDIAYQTNLLALNAAIEAARAGTQGKGFAVVAGEVRKLAERSQAAAQQIGELAKSSVAVAENAGQLLERIVPMIRETSSLVQEIAAASQEQMAAIREINVGVRQLDEVVQQNAAASHELAATSGDLASQSATLQDLVGFFQFRGDDTLSQRLHPSPLSTIGPLPPAPRPRRLPPPPPPRPTSPSPGDLPMPGHGGSSNNGPGHSRPQHGGHHGPSGGQHGGGIVVSLDPDDDFERFE